jgi:hypothetical protein
MKYQIDFFEIQGTTEVYRFSKEMVFANYDLLNNWIYEYLETSNIWKNKDILVKIETIPTPKKSIIFYYAEQ